MDLDSNAIYRVKPPYFPWGDYGRILLAGMSRHLPRKDGLIQLERTGPFVPPISFPGTEVVVTSPLREAIEKNPEFRLQFLPVIKQHIVWLEWEMWDTLSELPSHMPRSGEPEDYILTRRHSKKAAKMLGDLWEIVFPECSDTRLCASSWFIFEGSLRKVVTDSARLWLQKEAGSWVRFVGM